MISARAVVDAAASYDGVRWLHQGRDRNGIDCLGLIILVALDVGLAEASRFLAWDSRNYGRIPPKQLAKELIAGGVRRVGKPVIGGIGLFAQPGTYPSHVGIFGDGEMIHAYAPSGKVVRHGYSEPWPGRLRGCFAYPGVSDEV